MIRYRRFAAVVTILALAVSSTGQDDPHAGVETGEDNAVVDAVFASWDLPGIPLFTKGRPGTEKDYGRK